MNKHQLIKELKTISSLICVDCPQQEICKQSWEAIQKCWRYRLVNVVREMVNNK